MRFLPCFFDVYELQPLFHDKIVTDKKRSKKNKAGWGKPRRDEQDKNEYGIANRASIVADSRVSMVKGLCVW